MDETSAAMSGEGTAMSEGAAPEASGAWEFRGREETGWIEAAADDRQMEAGETPAAEPEAVGWAPGGDFLQRLAREHRGLAEDLRRTQDERARIVAQEQIRQIGELDGDIHSMDDLLDMPEFEGFYALVKKGVNLVEAFKLSRYEALMKKQADKAARQAMQSAVTRQHMTSLAGGAGSGEYTSVPAEVAAQFRLAKPGITDGEIRKKYRKYQKYKRQ